MILGWVYSWLGHIGLSIILLSVIVKILLYPLSRLAEKWQSEVNEIQAWLQPRLKEIKAQYTGEEAHKRTLALYKEKKVSPMFTFKSLAGLLIQIPVFIAVFDMLGESILLKQQSFLWIKDLSMPDHWMNLPFLIPFFGESFNLLPLLMMLVTALGAFFFQDQHLKGTLLKQQKRKLYLMAFAFFILFYTFPAGMVLYWTTANSLQLIKALVVKHKT
jgi:YidC/Oxa1 family membrane protein insertase